MAEGATAERFCSTLGYPNGVTATYTYDFADRQSTLQMQNGTSPAQTLVSASSYKPLGPLASLTLGNGLTETHGYSTRYLPTSIAVSSLLSWSYTNDSVGNPTAIADTLNSANNRTYAYQDPQYFLTTGNGPWGTRSWTYDRIGNRLTQTADGGTDSFSYGTNASGGNTPLLDGYSYDETGDLLTPLSSGGDLLVSGGGGYTYGDDRRMSGNDVVSSLSHWSATYDGRGFLSEMLSPEEALGNHASVHPTYNSGGLLLHRNFNQPSGFSSIPTDLYIFYFAGRPVATLENVSGGPPSSTLSYLTTDHLGTPILITNTSGSQVWQGGFEPFGDDYSGAPTILRLPGQWVEDNSGLYYNVNRWYASGSGLYTQPDPVSVPWGRSMRDFIYGGSAPTLYRDPLGLAQEDAYVPFGGVACSGPNQSTPTRVPKPDPACNHCNKAEVGAGIAHQFGMVNRFCSSKPAPYTPRELGERPSGVAFHEDSPFWLLPWFKPSGNECIDYCRCIHEVTHVTDVIQARNTGTRFDNLTSECRAYQDSMRCLLNYR
jgi:RHS repeat-associated protein